MQNGIELISHERIEQINANGFEKDLTYQSNELVNAALFLLTNQTIYYPSTLSEEYQKEFGNKTAIEKLIVAGALIAAEIDRIQNTASDTEYDSILANAEHNTGFPLVQRKFVKVKDISSFDRAASLSDENWRHDNMQTRTGRSVLQHHIDCGAKFEFYYAESKLRWRIVN